MSLRRDFARKMSLESIKKHSAVRHVGNHDRYKGFAGRISAILRNISETSQRSICAVSMLLTSILFTDHYRSSFASLFLRWILLKRQMVASL